MSKFIDYYKILGVSKDIPQSEIKAAYRKRSKQFHPDLHPDDPKAKAKFQMLNEAYDVLSDPDKRARYDQYGAQWNSMGGGNGQNGAYGGNPFGGGFNPFGGQAGGDPFGQGFEFNFGSGGFSDFFSELFSGIKNKRSTRRASSANPFGSQPPTESQAAITIDMYQALLGDEIVITVENERLKMKIKPGTQPGTKMRLKGKGTMLPNGTRGDLILTLNVALPKNLTERQKQLLNEMRGQ